MYPPQLYTNPSSTSMLVGGEEEDEELEDGAGASFCTDSHVLFLPQETSKPLYVVSLPCFLKKMMA